MAGQRPENNEAPSALLGEGKAALWLSESLILALLEANLLDADTILEAMDLSQLDTSARHAALGDVVITPRFGPAEWRDFHLADLFLQAGRAAASEQLSALQALSRPVDLEAARREAAVV